MWILAPLPLDWLPLNECHAGCLTDLSRTESDQNTSLPKTFSGSPFTKIEPKCFAWLRDFQLSNLILCSDPISRPMPQPALRAGLFV